MTNKIERKISWTNSKGQSVEARIGIRTERTLNADGDTCTVPCCEWYEDVELDGHTIGYAIEHIAPQMVGAIRVTGRCGTVGIPDTIMDQIDVAKAELRATDVWQAHEADAIRARQEADEYAAHTARVERAMTGNGRTY